MFQAMQSDISTSSSAGPGDDSNPSRVVDVTIESLAYGGEGVAHTPRTLFVAGAAPGDRLRVRVLEEKERWARGKILEVLDPSPSRREPPCPLAPVCGGCQWQHVTEEAQREAKRRAVEDALRRIGRLGEVSVAPLLFAGPPLGYRRRTRLQVAWPGGRLHLGFYEPASRKVVDVADCAQMSPGLGAAYAALREALAKGPPQKGLGSVELAVGSDNGPGVAAFRLHSHPPRETRRGVSQTAQSRRGDAGGALHNPAARLVILPAGL
jgi:23S rRNA (uracil1939-C5)-methyltransferase